MADVSSFLPLIQPFDPIKQWQAQQTLTNSRLEGEGRAISNDSNQTDLQVKKMNNVIRMMSQHLGDDKVTKADLHATINDGLANGSFTPQQANLARANIDSKEDNPLVLQQFLAKQTSSMLDAKQALDNLNRPGPTWDQGDQLQPTTRGNYTSLTPNALTNNGPPIDLHRTPEQQMQPGNLRYRDDDGIVRDHAATSGQVGAATNPLGSKRFDTQPKTAPAPAPQSSTTPGTPGAPFKNVPAGVTPDEHAAALAVLEEAGNQGPEGMAAVAHVIKTRAAASGTSPQDVVLAPGQFEAVHSAGPRARMDARNTDSPAYRNALQIVRDVNSGKTADPTGGADHYYNPVLQAKLGRAMPAWDQGGPSTMVGAHKFLKLGYTAAPGAGAGAPAPVPAPAGAGAPAPAPAGAGAPAPAGADAGAAPTPVVTPAVPVGGAISPTNPKLALETSLGEDTKAGQEARAADFKRINDNPEYDGQKQARWTTLNLLYDPKNWTGGGQSFIKNMYDKLVFFGLADQKNTDRIDAIAHALQKAQGISATDAKDRLNAIANGSSETSKGALIDLVRQTHAASLASEAKIRLNQEGAADQYLKIPPPDPRVIEAMLQPSLAARQEYVKKLHLSKAEADKMMATEQMLRTRVPEVFRNTGSQ